MSGHGEPALAPVTPDPWQALRAHTPARIALGRSGASLPTRELLAFGCAHAQARDAVQRALDVESLLAQLRQAGVGDGVLRLHSAAPDRATYLLRPDLGRRLDRAGRSALSHAAGARPRGDRWLLPVVADGLSALAAERQAAPLLAALRAQTPPGWSLGPVVIAEQARVALGDEIGEALQAPLVAMLIGERPGLSSPDSLGVYLTAAPRRGRTDAERNCLSNIRPEGLAAESAARKLWWLAQAAQRAGGVTGVSLKDLSDTAALEGGAGPA